MRPKSKSLQPWGCTQGCPWRRKLLLPPQVPCFEGGQLLAGMMLEGLGSPAGVPPALGRGCGALGVTAGDGAGMELREPPNPD